MEKRSWQEILKEGIDEAEKKARDQKKTGPTKGPFFLDDINHVSLDEIFGSIGQMKSEIILEHCEKNGIPVTNIVLSDGYVNHEILVESEKYQDYLDSKRETIEIEEEPESVLPESNSPTEPAMGINEAGEFFINAAWRTTLTQQERTNLAEHERMHLRYNDRLSVNQKQDCLVMLAMFEIGAWELLDKMQRPAGQDLPSEEEAPPTIRSASHPEASCKTCDRKNTVGSDKCWWCETPNPC